MLGCICVVQGFVKVSSQASLSLRMPGIWDLNMRKKINNVEGQQ